MYGEHFTYCTIAPVKTSSLQCHWKDLPGLAAKEYKIQLWDVTLDEGLASVWDNNRFTGDLYANLWENMCKETFSYWFFSVRLKFGFYKDLYLL